MEGDKIVVQSCIWLFRNCIFFLKNGTAFRFTDCLRHIASASPPPPSLIKFDNILEDGLAQCFYRIFFYRGLVNHNLAVAVNINLAKDKKIVSLDYSVSTVHAPVVVKALSFFTTCY